MHIQSMKHQSGVSLIVALVVLLVITILGISSVRLSSQDLMIASNEQQQMMVSQASESASRKTAIFYNVYKWLEDGTQPDTQTRQVTSGNITSDVEISRGAEYICFGQSGEAMSIGPGSTRCRVYTFAIDSRLAGTGARDRLYKGQGKELPAATGGN